MFSIRQNFTQRSSRLPRKRNILGMDTVYKAQPFVQVVGKNEDTIGLNFVNKAQPFVAAFDNRQKSQLILSGNNHPDVQLWLNNISLNGGSASSGTISALNTFCNSIDSAGLRSKFYRLNLFCGDNLNSALVPLYVSTNWLSPSYGFSDYDRNFNFTNSDYYETGSSAGLTSSGADPTQQLVGTKYLDTGFFPSMVGPAGSLIDNLHIAATVSTTAISAAFQSILYATNSYVDLWWLGIQLLSGYANVRASITQASSNGINAQLSPLSTGLVSPATHLISSRLTTTDFRVYQAGSQLGSTNTTPITVTLTQPTPTFLLFRQSAGYYSNLRLSDYSFGKGLTSSEASSYSSILQTFKNSLSRT